MRLRATRTERSFTSEIQRETVGISRSIAHDHLYEGIDILAAQAPDLTAALTDAKARRPTRRLRDTPH